MRKLGPPARKMFYHCDHCHSIVAEEHTGVLMAIPHDHYERPWRLCKDREEAGVSKPGCYDVVKSEAGLVDQPNHICDGCGEMKPAHKARIICEPIVVNQPIQKKILCEDCV